MTRSYALGMGAGTQVITHLPWFVLMRSTPGETGRVVMMGFAWAINAAVAEYVIRSRAASAGGRGTRARAALVATT